MNPDTTPTPTWKFCKAFNSALLEDEKEGERLNEILCADKDEAECLVDLLNGKERELTEKTNEVARLREELMQAKEMVMDAARRGDQMAAHWKERAKKAEAIIQQLHHFAGIIEGFQNATK